MALYTPLVPALSMLDTTGDQFYLALVADISAIAASNNSLEDRQIALDQLMVNVAAVISGADSIQIDLNRVNAAMSAIALASSSSGVATAGNISNPLFSLPCKRAGEIGSGSGALFGARYSGLSSYFYGLPLSLFASGHRSTYVNADSGLLVLANGEARVESMKSGGRAFLIESSRRYAVSSNHDFNHAAWIKGSSIGIVPNATAGPDGTLSAAKILGLGTSIVSSCVYQYLGVLNADAKYEPSVWLQAISTVGILSIVADRASFSRGEYHIDLSLLSSVKMERVSRNHPAVTVVHEFLVTMSQITQFAMMSASGEGLSVYAYGAQMDRDFVQSTIPTGYFTQGELSVVPDRVIFDYIGNVDANNFVILMDVECFGLSVVDTVFASIPGILPDFIVGNSGGGMRCQFDAAGALVSPIIADPVASKVRIGCIVSNGVARSIFNGSLGSPVNVPLYTFSPSASLQIGGNGYVSNVRVFDYLSDTEISLA